MQNTVTVTQQHYHHPFVNSTSHYTLIRPTFQHKLQNTQRHSHNLRTWSRVFSVKSGTQKAVELEFDEESYADDDDDEGFVPFPKMKEWLENKPKGFGEGKVYDTEIEDRLVQEFQRTKVATAKSKDTAFKKMEAPEAVPSGIPVRLLNLPKKKNVHRDLKSAFEGVPGIVDISPAVSGNKKTRDPICKGFGFVYFKTEEHALRFVQMFSRQNITFGKVQKQIKCELVKSGSFNSSHQHPVDKFDGSQSMDSSYKENLAYDLDINERSMGSWEPTGEESDELDDEALTSEFEDIDEDFEYVNELKVSTSTRTSNDTEPLMDSKKDSFPSKQKIKARGNNKKPVPNQKKLRKLEIPGSAKRLKVKEKSVLTGVLSKYGAKPAAEG